MVRIAIGNEAITEQQYSILCTLDRRVYALGIVPKNGKPEPGLIDVTENPGEARPWTFTRDPLGGYTLNIKGFFLSLWFLATGAGGTQTTVSRESKTTIFLKQEGEEFIFLSQNIVLTADDKEICFRKLDRHNWRNRSIGGNTFVQSFKFVSPAGKNWVDVPRHLKHPEPARPLKLRVDHRGKVYYLACYRGELLITDQIYEWDMVSADPFGSFTLKHGDSYLGCPTKIDDSSANIPAVLTSKPNEAVEFTADYFRSSISLIASNKADFRGGGLTVDVEKAEVFFSANPDIATDFAQPTYYWLRFARDGKVLEADKKTGIHTANQRTDNFDQLWSYDGKGMLSLADGRRLTARSGNGVDWLEPSDEGSAFVVTADAVSVSGQPELMLSYRTPWLVRSQHPTGENACSLVRYKSEPNLRLDQLRFYEKVQFVLCNMATNQVLAADAKGSVYMQDWSVPAAANSLWAFRKLTNSIIHVASNHALDSSANKITLHADSRYARWGISSDGVLVRRGPGIKVLGITTEEVSLQDFAKNGDKRQRWHVVPVSAIQQHSHPDSPDRT